MYTIGSFFAGVGGIDIGFEQTGKFKTIYMNEILSLQADILKKNFPEAVVVQEDINNLNLNEIPDMDIIVGGFPCQSFSCAGKQKGFEDKRGTLFFSLAKIIESKKPKIIFLENVSNLERINNGQCLQEILKEIDRIGYNYTYKVLNATQYGNIPQNRKRLYIVGTRKDIKNKFCFPEPIKLTTRISDIIDFENKVEDEYYIYENNKSIVKNKIYKSLKEIENEEDKNNPTCYQFRRSYIRKNKKHTIPTLIHSQAQQRPLVITKYGYRYMTNEEIFKAQGFPKKYIPKVLSFYRMSEMAGNSVCVPVIYRIAEKIAEVLE